MASFEWQEDPDDKRDEMALEAAAALYFNVEAQFDAKTTIWKKKKFELDKQKKAAVERNDAKTDVELQKVLRTIEYYEKIIREREEQLFTGGFENASTVSYESVDENPEYKLKKKLLDDELQADITVLETDFNRKKDKANAEYAQKLEKLKVTFSVREIREERKAEKTTKKKEASCEQHLKHLNEKLKEAEAKKEAIYKIRENAPRTVAEIKLQEDFDLVDDEYKKLSDMKNQYAENLRNLKQEIGLNQFNRQQRKKRLEEEERAAKKAHEELIAKQYHEEFLQKQKEKEEWLSKHNLTTSAPTDNYVAVDMGFTKEEQRRRKEASEVFSKYTNLKNQMKAKYPATTAVLSFRNINDNVVLIAEDKNQEVLYYKWFDTVKEFKRQYDFMDMLEYHEDFEEIFEKCPKDTECLL